MFDSFDFRKKKGTGLTGWENQLSAKLKRYKTNPGLLI